MPISWLYPKPFVRQLTVAEESIDGLGHVNNIAYLKWCEDTAWQHSAHLGLTMTDWLNVDRAMAITRAEYDYLAAAFTGEQISVATWLVTSDLKLTMERRFQIVRDADGKTLFTGRWQLVCINISSGRPARLPRQFIEIYGPNLVSAQGANLP